MSVTLLYLMISHFNYLLFDFGKLLKITKYKKQLDKLIKYVDGRK